MASSWLILGNRRNWELALRLNVWGFTSKQIALWRDIREGDIIFFYVTKPVKGVVGYGKVEGKFENYEPLWNDEKAANRVIWPLKVRFTVIHLLPNERWETEAFKEIRTYPPTHRRLTEEERLLIVKGLTGKPINQSIMSQPEQAASPGVTSTQHRSHSELQDILIQLGEALGFIAKKEENTPDKLYRCDVTWREFEKHNPIKVFEIELSGNVDHALASLSHAFDIWGARHLFLILQDEADSQRASRLLTGKLSGAFARIGKHVRVHTWLEIDNLHKDLNKHMNLMTELAKREL